MSLAAEETERGALEKAACTVLGPAEREFVERRLVVEAELLGKYCLGRSDAMGAIVARAHSWMLA